MNRTRESGVIVEIIEAEVVRETGWLPAIPSDLMQLPRCGEPAHWEGFPGCVVEAMLESIIVRFEELDAYG